MQRLIGILLLCYCSLQSVYAQTAPSFASLTLGQQLLFDQAVTALKSLEGIEKRPIEEQQSLRDSVLDTLTTLLTYDLPVAIADPRLDQHTLLSLALSMQQKPIIKRLLAHVDPDTLQAPQRSLFYAARLGDLAILNQVIQLTGIEQERVLETYALSTRCELDPAITGGHLAVLQRLYPLRKTNCPELPTLLTQAIEAKQLPIFEWLLAQSSTDMKAYFVNQSQWQQLASITGDIAWVDKLSLLGVDFSQDNGAMYAAIALKKHSLAMVKRLEALGNSEILPAVAVQYGNLEVLRYYQQQGVELDPVQERLPSDVEGFTKRDDQLLDAVRFGQLEVVKFLQQSGSVLNQPKTCPLLTVAAASNGDVDLLAYLLEQKQPVTSPCEDGATPLKAAVANNQAYLVAAILYGKRFVNDGLALLDKGALSVAAAKLNSQMINMVGNAINVNEVNQYGNTPLHALVNNMMDDDLANRAALLHLLNLRPDINRQNDSGDTPLIMAALNGDLFTVTELINRGAAVNLSNSDGNSALHTVLATMSSQPVLAKLLEANANEHLRNRSGYSVLHYAVSWQVLLSETVPKGVKDFVQRITAASLLDWQTEAGETALMLATKQNATAWIALLLEKGANTKLVDQQGNTALHYAALQGNQEVMKSLIAAGADVNARNNNGDSALFLAQDAQTTSTLLESGASATVVNKAGESPLTILTQNAEKRMATKQLKLLLNASPQLSQQNALGQSALHLAIKYHALDAIEILLKAGIDVNLMDNEGNTALHYAIRSRSLVPLRLLLRDKDNVKLDSPNQYGLTALQLAVALGQTKAFQLLIAAKASIHTKDQDQRTPLHTALDKPNSSAMLVQSLLDAGADVNARTRGEWTPLHFAARYGNDEQVQMLLAAGANTQVVSWGQETALDIAKKYQHAAVVKRLAAVTAANQTTEEANQYGRTALHLAIRAGDIKNVKQALSAGADVNARTVYGETPLLLAVRLSQADKETAQTLVGLLLAAGADPNARIPQGDTILHHAIKRYASSHIIQQLIDKQAALQVNDAYGKPLFISAIERGDVATVNVLLQADADLLLLKDKQQRHALQVAIKYNYTELALNLLSRGVAVNIGEIASDPLAIALSHQNLVIARALFKAGAKLQQSDTDTTLLMNALAKEQHDVVWWLLQSGYTLKALTDQDSKALLETVAMLGNDYLDIVKYLFEHYDFKRKLKKEAPIRASLLRDADQLLAYFISIGMEWDKKSAWIREATEKNAVRSLCYFQQQGLALDTLNDEGENALFVAVRYQAVEALAWLIQQGVDTKQIANNGQNILDQLQNLSSYIRLSNHDYLTKSKQILALLPQLNYSFETLYQLIANQQYDLARLLIIARQPNLNKLLPNVFNEKEVSSLWSAFGYQSRPTKERQQFVQYLIEKGLKFQFSLPDGKTLNPYFNGLINDMALSEFLLQQGYKPNKNEVREAFWTLINNDKKGKGMALLQALLDQGAVVDEAVLASFASRHWSEVDSNAKIAAKYALLLKHFTPTTKTNQDEAEQQTLPLLMSLLSNQSLCDNYPEIILQQIAVTTDANQLLLPAYYANNPPRLFCLRKPTILKAVLAKPPLQSVLSQQRMKLLWPIMYSLADLKAILPVLLSSGMPLQNRETNQDNLAYWWINQPLKIEEVLEGLKYLANLGVDLTQKNKAGDYLSHAVLRQANQAADSVRLLDFLISKGLKADAVGANQETLLHILIDNEKLDEPQRLLILKRLLALKPNLNAQDAIGNTPLHRAILSKQWSLINMLLTKINTQGSEILNQRRESPLHLLIGQNQTDLSLRLLAMTNDVNQTDQAGNTLLLRLSQSACQMDCVKLAEQLLEKGVNLQQQNNAGETALTLTAYQGNIPLATFLIAKGIPLDQQNRYGNTAAHIALWRSAGLLDVLIQQGANLEVTNWQDKTVRAALNSDITTAAHAAVASMRYPDWSWPDNIQSQWTNEALLFRILGEKRLIAAKALLTLYEPIFYRDPQSNNTLLHQAARHNMSEVIEKVLPSRYQVDILNNAGYTPLHVAVASQALQAVEVLLAQGADAKILDDNDEDALQIAIASRNTELALLLLNSKTDFDFTRINSESQTAVQAAISNNDLILLKALVQRGADINAADTAVLVASPLFLAIEQGNVEMVSWLIKQGVNVNEIPVYLNSTQQTPLLHAVWYYVTQREEKNGALLSQYLAIIKLLLANKANINAVDDQGQNALYIGIPVYEIAQLLLSKGADITLPNQYGEAPFFQAVRSQYPKQDGERFLQALVDAGAEFDIRNMNQETPLQSAIRNNNSVAIDFLLRKGADPNAVKEDTQFTLAMYVISSYEVLPQRKLPLLKQLKAAGADLKRLNNNQENLLFLALRYYLPQKGGEAELQWLLQQYIPVTQINNHFETLGHVLLNTESNSDRKMSQWLTILIKAGIDINALDANNQNLLHLAIKRQKNVLIPLLLAEKIDLNEQDLQGASALHLLVKQVGKGQLDLALIEQLLTAGANPNLRDRRGETVLHLANRYAQTELITLLQQFGADANIKNYQGQRPAEAGQKDF